MISTSPIEVFHPLGDLLDRHRLVAGQVVDAVGGDVVQAARDAVGEVLDVDEVAGLHAVAGQRQRVAGQRLVDERRDDRGLTGARAVGDAEAQDRVVDPVELLVGLAVELAGELGGGVEVAGRREQRVLVDLIGLGSRSRPRSWRRRRSRLTPARRAASSTVTVPRALTRSASSGEAWTSLTSATAARWATASQECSARSSASRSVIEPSTVSTGSSGSRCQGEGRRS